MLPKRLQPDRIDSPRGGAGALLRSEINALGLDGPVVFRRFGGRAPRCWRNGSPGAPRCARPLSFPLRFASGCGPPVADDSKGAPPQCGARGFAPRHENRRLGAPFAGRAGKFRGGSPRPRPWWPRGAPRGAWHPASRSPSSRTRGALPPSAWAPPKDAQR